MRLPSFSPVSLRGSKPCRLRQYFRTNTCAYALMGYLESLRDLDPEGFVWPSDRDLDEHVRAWATDPKKGKPYSAGQRRAVMRLFFALGMCTPEHRKRRGRLRPGWIVASPRHTTACAKGTCTWEVQQALNIAAMMTFDDKNEQNRRFSNAEEPQHQQLADDGVWEIVASAFDEPETPTFSDPKTAVLEDQNLRFSTPKPPLFDPKTSAFSAQNRRFSNEEELENQHVEEQITGEISAPNLINEPFINPAFVMSSSFSEPIKRTPEKPKNFSANTRNDDDDDKSKNGKKLIKGGTLNMSNPEGKTLMEVLGVRLYDDVQSPHATKYLDELWRLRGSPIDDQPDGPLAKMLDDGIRFCKEHELRYAPFLLRRLKDLERGQWWPGQTEYEHLLHQTAGRFA